MENLRQTYQANQSKTFHKSGYWFTDEIQEHVPFALDPAQMEILVATAEVIHSNIVIGQIQKADFGIKFKPYQENIADLGLYLLLQYHCYCGGSKKGQC